ncbi:TIGR00266 family protein [Bremerella cremea]|uniref:TIGR00266 family protein n=1 Tax=Bremerella cremea TaxID=1031537 RepID=A0A368KXF4_9BACT|nr:TIGR00266 family protein [Bremerella cremea]RCS55982.1 TIGR00266 family protein [Bremerella cremea]
MASDEAANKINYEVLGEAMQLLEVELDPGKTIIAEAGTMCYMEEDIQFEAKMGDGSKANQGFFGSLMQAGGRMLTGESIFITHFTNHGGSKKRVAFAAPFPGKIIPLDLTTVNGRIICQKDSFLCASHGTRLSVAFSKRLGAGFFGGNGFIMQRVEGDGMAFMHACGTIIKRELRGETLRVEAGCLVGFTDGIDFDIQRAGNLKSMVFGGEGLFLASLQGEGTVYMQSLPFNRMAERIVQHAPGKG